LQRSAGDAVERARLSEAREQFLKSKLGEIIEQRKQDRARFERMREAPSIAMQVVSPSVTFNVSYSSMGDSGAGSDAISIRSRLPVDKLKKVVRDDILGKYSRIMASQDGDASGPLDAKTWSDSVATALEEQVLQAVRHLFEETGASLSVQASKPT